MHRILFSSRKSCFCLSGRGADARSNRNATVHRRPCVMAKANFAEKVLALIRPSIGTLGAYLYLLTIGDHLCVAFLLLVDRSIHKIEQSTSEN